MLKSELADQSARDRFIQELDRNFCVSASAGAGKTTAIVKRIVAMAQEDMKRAQRGEETRLSRLVVVTYGVLAAEELRVRARQEIFETMSGGGIHPQQLLAEFNQAYFGTIHSFCLKLIHEEGRHAGLPGTVQLLEEKDEALWQRFVETDIELPIFIPDTFLSSVLRHYTFEDLLKLSRQLRPDDARRLTKAIPKGEASILDFREAYTSRSKSAELEPNKRILHEWQEEYLASNAFLALPRIEKGGAEFQAGLKEGFAPYLLWLNKRASYLAGHLALAYARFRQDEGFLTYDDMIGSARELFEKAEILRRLRARGYIIVLDEAQDTDSSMFDILTELTRPLDAEPFVWPKDMDVPAPLPGRFCFVGDDQQAIYGSRAELVHYRRYLKAFREGSGGESLEFHVTMRCPGKVIEQVNAIFPKRLDQPLVDFRRLTARPSAAEGSVLWLALNPPETDKVSEQFEEECRQVVPWLKEQGLEGLGIQRWSEVALLCPRIDWLSIASRVLKENGLPSRLISSKERRSDLPGYSWPVALLHVLSTPTDRFELIGVLREVFGVSDAELLKKYRESGVSIQTGNGRSEGGTLRTRMDDALNLLSGLEEGLKEKMVHEEFSLSGFVEKIFGDLHLKERIEAVGEDAGPLDYFLHEARLAEAEGKTLSAWIGKQRKNLARPPLLSPGNPDEIQLLTSQKSKGLEWPVVVVMGVGRAIGSPKVSYPLIERSGERFQVHFSGMTSDEESKEKMKSSKEQELQRLFYVMLTRAKKLLVIPDSHGFYKMKTPSFSGLSRWESVERIETDLFSRLDTPVEQIAWKKGVELVVSEEDIRQGLAGAQAVPLRVLPHELAIHDEPRSEKEVTPLLTGVGGTDYGTWWHAVLQQYPWAGEEKDQQQYIDKALVELGGNPGLLQRGKEELDRWQGSEARLNLMSKGKIFLPEVPFLWPQTESKWMEGIADLLVVLGDGSLAVLDWKTNRPRPNENDGQSLKRLVEMYAGQLQAYARMLESVSGRKVAKVWLYGTVSGKLVEVPTAEA